VRNVANLVPVYAPDGGRAMASRRRWNMQFGCFASNTSWFLGHAPVRRHPRLHRQYRPAVARRTSSAGGCRCSSSRARRSGRRDHETMADFTTRIEEGGGVFRSLEKPDDVFLSYRPSPSAANYICMALISVWPKVLFRCSIRRRRNLAA